MHNKGAYHTKATTWHGTPFSCVAMTLNTTSFCSRLLQWRLQHIHKSNRHMAPLGYTARLHFPVSLVMMSSLVIDPSLWKRSRIAECQSKVSFLGSLIGIEISTEELLEATFEKWQCFFQNLFLNNSIEEMSTNCYMSKRWTTVLLERLYISVREARLTWSHTTMNSFGAECKVLNPSQN